jgi:hypothetical protein
MRAGHTPGSPDLGGQRLELRDASCHQRNVHAESREFARQAGANARGSARDEHTGIDPLCHIHGLEF